jgi:hypothetical protein
MDLECLVEESRCQCPTLIFRPYAVGYDDLSNLRVHHGIHFLLVMLEDCSSTTPALTVSSKNFRKTARAKPPKNCIAAVPGPSTKPANVEEVRRRTNSRDLLRREPPTIMARTIRLTSFVRRYEKVSLLLNCAP